MKIKWLLLALLIVIAGCGKKSDNPIVKPDDKPAGPLLITPAPNEICTSGTILSDTTAAITFKWGAVSNVSSYRFYVQDLFHESGIMKILNTNSFTITLKRNKPYSWTVVAVNKIGEGQSEERRFYLAGKGVTTYAPFPAQLLSPYQGESLVTSFPTVAVSWKGSSVSNNIVDFDLYFGNVNDPPLFKSDLPFNANIVYYPVPVENGKTYFWRVVTKDANGNTSTSPLFQFNNR